MAQLIKRIIATELAPKPVAAYSQAIVYDRTVYVSGQLGIDLETSKLVDGAGPQTKLALKHLETILKAADSSIQNVIKTTIFLDSITDYAAVNAEYSKVFGTDSPARSCFQVGKLPLNGLVEIEAIAATGDVKVVSSL